MALAVTILAAPLLALANVASGPVIVLLRDAGARSALTAGAAHAGLLAACALLLGSVAARAIVGTLWVWVAVAVAATPFVFGLATSELVPGAPILAELMLVTPGALVLAVALCRTENAGLHQALASAGAGRWRRVALTAPDRLPRWCLAYCGTGALAFAVLPQRFLPPPLIGDSPSPALERMTLAAALLMGPAILAALWRRGSAPPSRSPEF